MKLKIAKVSITLHEVEIKGKCQTCGNILTAHDGDKMHLDSVQISEETVYLDPKPGTYNGEPLMPFHRMADRKSKRYIVGLTCGGCGEVIVGRDTIVEPMSEREREHLKTLMRDLGDKW